MIEELAEQTSRLATLEKSVRSAAKWLAISSAVLALALFLLFEIIQISMSTNTPIFFLEMGLELVAIIAPIAAFVFLFRLRNKRKKAKKFAKLHNLEVPSVVHKTKAAQSWGFAVFWLVVALIVTYPVGVLFLMVAFSAITNFVSGFFS